MRRSLLVVLGVPLLCLVGLAAFPLGYGTGDPPDLVDGIWMFCASVVDFAKVTVFSLRWWVVAGTTFLALNLRHRAQAIEPATAGRRGA